LTKFDKSLHVGDVEQTVCRRFSLWSDRGVKRCKQVLVVRLIGCLEGVVEYDILERCHVCWVRDIVEVVVMEILDLWKACKRVVAKLRDRRDRVQCLSVHASCPLPVGDTKGVQIRVWRRD
jgi:hypothetical protein